MRMFFLTLFLSVFTCSAALAIEDNQANREAAAERYYEEMDAEEMMGDMARALSMNLPPSEREKFQSFMLDYVNYKLIEESSKASLARHLTADEINALADFYALPVAKSAMKKFGFYMAEVMPIIQAEMMRAIGEKQRIDAENNRQKQVE